jgi:hypothetical protein
MFESMDLMRGRIGTSGKALALKEKQEGRTHQTAADDLGHASQPPRD